MNAVINSGGKSQRKRRKEMALTILIRTQMNAVPALADVCFTKQNYGVNTNTTLGVSTPRGVLGGSIAAVSAGNDYVVVPCDLSTMPVGLFVNDAAGAAFDNAPAVASGKVTVIKGMASVEVDVFETRNAANSGDLVYVVGQPLYSSAQGFLTNEVSTSAVVVGVVTKIPTTASPVLGLDMRI
jgi:hypothetical protein